MDRTLNQINVLLRQGLNTSRQGSYHRRAPAPEAVPLLEEARRELETWIQEHGETAESLRLLAIAQEAVLDYGSAQRTLQKVIGLSSSPDRKDLKRLAACREAGQTWRQLALTPDELDTLGGYLRNKLLDTAPEKSLCWTEHWLNENKPGERSQIINSLRRLGYFSDYEVLHNLVPG